MSGRLTKEQAAWCVRYRQNTTFEPLMDDFRAGNESFLDAAKKSARWFEEWSCEAYSNISQHYPGED